MPIIKCKMCGGDLEIIEGSSVCECAYCGTRQTVPSADNEKKLTLFARAGRLLRACEFDKAAGVYESIVTDFNEEAEAYWGLILCKFGIEYVDDPATGNKVPTCHRSSFNSLMDDPNFDMVMECADPIARRVYREEAKQIEELRKRIIEVSAREEPYDVFISYKELAEDGQRTLDSVIAQDIYAELTEKGYRVFFSRISLEDKLGVEYEPYIFAALNSAKVMLVVGTDYDYFNAVWVKNEWSRFLSLISKGEKKTLIPVFKSIDAYDMPKEFRKLAAQDMGKVGAMQDLMRGVEKILGRSNSVKNPPNSFNESDLLLSTSIKRGNMALEDGEWARAKDLFDHALAYNAESAEAYLGLLMAITKASNFDDLCQKCQSDTGFLSQSCFMRAKKYATGELRNKLYQLEEEAKTSYENRVTYLKQTFGYHSMISAGDSHTVAARIDGSVIGTGNNQYGQINVSGWTGIISVSAGGNHTLGLRADGKVVATGYNNDGRCNVSNWNNIIAISAGSDHSVGLRPDGTVIAIGGNLRGQCQVASWKDIKMILASQYRTFGVKKDGTVVFTGESSDYEALKEWREIEALACSGPHIVGLKNDGTLFAHGLNNSGQCEVADWRNVVAIAAGYTFTVGLKADGKVLFSGKNEDKLWGKSEWDEIVSISAAGHHVVAIKKNGSALAGGMNDKGQCNVSYWKLFDGDKPVAEQRKAAEKKAAEEQKAAEERAEKERIAAKEKAELERKQMVEKHKAKLREERASLMAELPKTKGLFTGSKKAKIEARLAEIDAELREMEQDGLRKEKM